MSQRASESSERDDLLLSPTLGHRLRAEANVSVDGHQDTAGVEVAIKGRF